MQLPGQIDTIAQNIQLAVAPVFLLTAIGTFLNVLAHRLSRVVDRARLIEENLHDYAAEKRTLALADLVVLDRRMAAVNAAIALCTLSALFICVVVATLFVGELLPMRASVLVAVLFIIATSLLTAGLMLFLYEIRIALRSVRVRAEVLTRGVANS